MGPEDGIDFSKMQDAPGRPTEADFQEKIEGYEQHRSIPRMFQQTVSELHTMMNGGGEPEVLEEYYPGWKSEDFREVLKRLGEL
jgi:hypothetical protein